MTTPPRKRAKRKPTDLFPSRRPKPPQDGTGCADDFGKSAKVKAKKKANRPIVAYPTEFFSVARRDGVLIGAFKLEGVAILEQAYQHKHSPEFRPYRVVAFIERRGKKN